MKAYDYQTQIDAIEYPDLAREYIAKLEQWLAGDIGDVLAMLHELPKPLNKQAFEAYQAVCLVVLEYALKKMSAAALTSKSPELNPTTKSLVKQSMMTNRISPEIIIGIANSADDQDVSEGA